MKLIMMTIMVTMMLVTVARGQKCQYNLGAIKGFSPTALKGEFYEVLTNGDVEDLAYLKVKFSYQSSSQDMIFDSTEVLENPSGKCFKNKFTFDASQAQKGVLTLPNFWSDATHTYSNKFYVIYLDDKYCIAQDAVLDNGFLLPNENTMRVFSKNIPLTYGDLPNAAKTQVKAFCGSTFDPATLKKMPLKTNIACTS